jgi:hypothetical protein
MLTQGLQIRRFCYGSASDPLVILGTSHNGLGDRLHIAAGTEQKPAGCGISVKAPWADCWHIADVTAQYANGRPNHCTKCHSRQI